MSDNYDNWLDILPEEILYKIYFRNVMNDINNLFMGSLCSSPSGDVSGYFLKKPLYTVFSAFAGSFKHYNKEDPYQNYNYNIHVLRNGYVITLNPQQKKSPRRRVKMFSAGWLKMMYGRNVGYTWEGLDQTIKEIKQVCRDNGIKGYSNKKRPELYKLILNCKTL
tara:strand:- start:3053 stop:3547 length:495 start_codon:yes stop_codon:yes gene_type:complete